MHASIEGSVEIKIKVLMLLFQWGKRLNVWVKLRGPGRFPYGYKYIGQITKGIWDIL